MAGKDPFAEPDDSERTFIKPNPAGRRGVADPMQAAAPSYAQPAARAEPMVAPEPAYGVPGQAQRKAAAPPPKTNEAGLNLAITGMNTLNACGTTLFSLISRIRNRAQHMDPEALRSSVVAEVRAFENAALKAGIEAQTVRVARYAICATIDDVVLNTPWGGQSVWGLQSMVSTFHKETVGGDRFYDLLARLEQEPANNIDLLEFLYMCLSLGFEGRLRVEQGGGEKHLQIRQGLARIIRAQRGLSERDLSPHWKGVDRPHRPRSLWKPVWIATAVAAVVLGITFVTLSWLLNAQTSRFLGQLSAMAATTPVELQRRAPPPPPPPVPDDFQMNQVKDFLAPEIEEGLVTVLQNANIITVRIAGAGMFGSGSDQVKPEFLPKIERIAQALNEHPGPLIIAGHSDNVPIRSSRFPSNMHLSLARAESVRALIAQRLDDTSRLTAEGRSDAEPIQSNDTAEGRAANRRIEILMMRAEQ